MEKGIKMEQEKILNDLANLPPEAQRQVFDFIDFLLTRYKKSPNRRKSVSINLADESFIGIWQDREDMKDSNKWLRNVRNSEWREPSL